MIQLKKTFEDILDYAYPDSKKLDMYKKVFVETIDETRKSFHGDYNGRKKRIRIFNLYRSDASLVATSIHELAHHVDYCNRGCLDHGDNFYAVYKQLLYVSLNMGIFTKEEFLKSTSDASDSNKVKAMLANFEPHPLAYKNNIVIVSVKNGYSHKEYLKESGYHWNSVQCTWDKEIDSDIADLEKNKLLSMKMEVAIREAKKFKMSRGTSIVAGKGSYNIRDFLKENGFRYNSKRKVWYKSGSKEEFEMYKNNYPNVSWTLS